MNDTTHLHPLPSVEAAAKELAEERRRLEKRDWWVRGYSIFVMLPECTLAQLKLVLQRLGSFELDWKGQKIPVTFSDGWKDYEMGDRPEEMLARADQALY